MIINLRLFLILASVFSALAGPFRAMAENNQRRNVEIELEPVEDATLYEFQVSRKDESKKTPMTFKLKEPKWSANIRPGLYTLKMRSYDERGVAGSWSEPFDIEVKLPVVLPLSPKSDSEVHVTDPTEHSLKFQWEPIQEAVHYKLTVKSTTTDWSQELTVKAAKVQLDLPVGQDYIWSVIAIDDRGVAGEFIEQPNTFKLRGPPLPKPRLEQPFSKYISEIKWESSPTVKTYNVTLKYKNPKTRAWEDVENKIGLTEPRLDLDFKRASGLYRIQVQAHSPRWPPSQVAQMDFVSRGGFRDPASFEVARLRDSITHPTHFYAIARYLITEMQYSSTRRETNATSKIGSALGGTGRIGLGYQNHESPWGGFGIVDLSGFVISGQNFRFASLEGHLTHKLEFGQRGILLFATGLFSKELPIVTGSPTLGYSGVGKVRGLGPHAGFTYWLPFNDRYGLQINARSYYTLTGSSSVGGKPQGALSYQYGLLGTYRLSHNWMGYAGYAFRHDEARYNVSPAADNYALPGQTNSIKIDGHYLNLILEFSF